jgi:hypothetical protein
MATEMDGSTEMGGPERVDWGPGHIELSLPARPDVLRLVRMAATFVATQADLPFEDIADLRLAIDELCSSVVASAATDARLDGSTLLVRYLWDHESVEVSCRLSTSNQASDRATADRSHQTADTDPWTEVGLGRDLPEPDGSPSFFSGQILSALVDEHHLSTGEGGWLRKRRVGALR